MSEQIQDVLARMDEQFEQKFDQKNKLEQSNQQNQLKNPESPNKYSQDGAFKNNPERKTSQTDNIDQDAYQQTRVIHLRTQPQAFTKQSDQDEEKQAQRQQDDSNYKQLSNKLETALRKIESTRRVITPKANDLYTRFDFYEKKKKREIQQKRRQVQAKRVFGVKEKPDINKHSKEIMNSKHQEPIFERTERLMAEKKKKQEQFQQLKRLKQQEEYKKYLQDMQAHSKIPENLRSSEQFYQNMKQWQQKKQQQVTSEAEKNKDKELIGATFKPQINKTSQKILGNKPRVPIYEREIKPKIAKEQFTFTPKINKRKT